MPREQATGNEDIGAVFGRYPTATRQRLLALRQLIFDTAAATPGVGRLTETLKWGQVSYLTAETGSGTTVRIDAEGDGVALFVNCRTDLLECYRSMYPTEFAYAGERAVLIDNGKPTNAAALDHCIALALTYHQRKRAPRG